MMTKLSVLVLFGGASPEYEVSCDSAASLIDSLSDGRYEVSCIGITKSGEWFYTEAEPGQIKNSVDWISHPSNKRVTVNLSKNSREIYVLDDNNAATVRQIDVAFPMIHGSDGEDGHIQGLLEVAGIPYVGSDVCSSACSMDKIVSMKFAEKCGLSHPRYYYCTSRDYLANPEQIASDILSHFDIASDSFAPLFIKPASAGSSIGISKVESKDTLRDALDLAARYGSKIIVEEGIKGDEIKVAVLGNEELSFGDICQIVVKDGLFNDYNTKYGGEQLHKKIPADLPEQTVSKIKSAAELIYRELGCSGFARADFFLTEDGEVVFNEINTVPGFSRSSIYPRMFESAGVSYEELVDALIRTALS